MKLVLEIKGDKIPKENDVLVFDEDEKIKNNRLGLLRSVNSFIQEIVDFSNIILK